MIRVGSGFKMQIKKSSKNDYDAMHCWLLNNYNIEPCSAILLLFIVHSLLVFSFFFLALLDYEGKADITLLNSVGRSASSKGRYPAIRTYRMTPHDHISAAAPS
jgi:hypothetical protein